MGEGDTGANISFHTLVALEFCEPRREPLTTPTLVGLSGRFPLVDREHVGSFLKQYGLSDGAHHSLREAHHSRAQLTEHHFPWERVSERLRGSQDVAKTLPMHCFIHSLIHGTSLLECLCHAGDPILGTGEGWP